MLITVNKTRFKSNNSLISRNAADIQSQEVGGRHSLSEVNSGCYS